MRIPLVCAVPLILCAACSHPTGAEPDVAAADVGTDVSRTDFESSDAGARQDLPQRDAGAIDVGPDAPRVLSDCDPNPCVDPFRSVCTQVGTIAQCDCDPGYEPDGMSAACAPIPCDENTVRSSACGPFGLGTQDEICLSEEWVLQDCVDPAVVELLADIMPGTDSGYGAAQAVVLGGVTLFVTRSPLGYELFSTDGTPAGTGLLYDFEPGAGDGISFQLALHKVGNRAVFVAEGQSPGVWSSDGTTAGTTLLKAGLPVDYQPYVGAADAFFEQVEVDPISGQIVMRHIWATDGTVAGTAMLMSNGQNEALRWSGATPFDASKSVIEVGTGTSREYELFCSDGTPGGTSSIGIFKDAGQGAAVGNSYFFAGAMATTPDGVELLVSDCAGSLDVIDISPSGPSYPRYFMPIGDDMLAFVAKDDVGWALWSVDSTMTPTRVFDLGSGNYTPSIGEHAVVDGSVLVFNYESTTAINGASLAATDGTVAGTVELMGEATGARREYGLYVAADHVFVKASREIWVTDGTVAGTRLLDSGASYPAGVLGDRFLFASLDGGSTTSTCGLWAASPDSVVQVEAFGDRESCPTFTSFGPDYAVFTQHDVMFGREPWVLRLR